MYYSHSSSKYEFVVIYHTGENYFYINLLVNLNENN